MGTVNFCCGYISKGRLLREGILAHNVVLYLVLLNLTNNPAPPRFVVNVIVSTPTSSTYMKSDTTVVLHVATFFTEIATYDYVVWTIQIASGPACNVITKVHNAIDQQVLLGNYDLSKCIYFF